jgi:hypothetical protein
LLLLFLAALVVFAQPDGKPVPIPVQAGDMLFLAALSINQMLTLMAHDLRSIGIGTGLVGFGRCHERSGCQFELRGFEGH